MGHEGLLSTVRDYKQVGRSEEKNTTIEVEKMGQKQKQ